MYNPYRKKHLVASFSHLGYSLNLPLKVFFQLYLDVKLSV